jgi:hypothetical protein
MGTMLRLIDLGRKLEPELVVLAWAITTSALTLAQIFQGNLTTQQYYGGVSTALLSPAVAFYLEILGLSAFAGMIIREPQRALFSFIGCFILTGFTTILVLMLPVFVNASLVTPELVFAYSFIDAFTALFPIPLVAGLAGTFLGTALGEHFLT